MDLHSTMIMYLTSTMASPVIKIAKTSKWLRLKTDIIDLRLLERSLSAAVIKIAIYYIIFR